MPRAKRLLSPEFREKAVAYGLDQNKSIGLAAREVGLGEATLGNWVSVARVNGSGRTSAVTSTENEELRRLKAENRELKMRVELLNKAALPASMWVPVRNR